jgi:hypothetical protein
MKYAFVLMIAALSITTTADAQIKVVVPTKTNSIMGLVGNCYTIASNGIRGVFNQSPEPAQLTQADTSGLKQFELQCVEYFYSKDQIDKLFADHDTTTQAKLDEVKKAYVEKISALSPEVLSAIKDEVKQQLMTELIPEMREEIKKQLEKAQSGKGTTSTNKAKAKVKPNTATPE